MTLQVLNLLSPPKYVARLRQRDRESVNGHAQALFTCRCGASIAVPLYEHDMRGEAMFDEPEGWRIELEKIGKRDAVVRCPEHRTVI